MRYRAWTLVSKLNARHMQFAWASLFSVAFADFYVLPAGHRHDLRPEVLLMETSSGTTTTSSSSGPAARACAPRSRRCEAGARTAVVCKSLLGKAHTVMAEGGIAAAMGNAYPEDNWRVHFRDTMRGGKMLNHWRMAQLHAQEAPDRVRELEDWGALFDRTDDGLISQRDFGGHRYARLAHVGDRTGLELIRTLQQRTVALGIDVFMECTVTRLLTDERRHQRRVRLLAGVRPVRRLAGAVGRAGHRRDRQGLQGHLELLGVHRRRSLARAAGRGVAGEHGVRPVPPDRHGLAAVGARAAGHRERPR